MRFRSALTLIELLLVMALISAVSASAYVLSANFRTRQALTSSAEDLVTNLRRAHVFSRESKDDRSWGIKKLNHESYSLVSRDEVGAAEITKFNLIEPIRFGAGNFEVWFDQGTGETANNVSIAIQTPNGEIKTVTVNNTGSAYLQ